VSLGRRAYVVCPLIEADGGEDPVAAVRAAERLQRQFPQFRVGLVHGRMPIEERSRAMERFRTGEAPLLVSTTVVEVGLDVPEATVILVERAERFGLSQLHQLRGRVGRGSLAGHCLLLTGPHPTPEAGERLAVLARTGDGFAVAEADLEIRGPGHLAGTRQAGLTGLRLADLVRDRGLLVEAREEARRIVAADPQFQFPEHRSLRVLAGEAAFADQAVGRAG
jgi:ATP-dependent DNA helicase RecG